MQSPFTSRAVVLQSLLGGECYGLEMLERLKRKMNTKAGKKILFYQGSIYPVLRLMKEEGLLASRVARQDPTRGGRPRTYFKLTARGKRVALDYRTVALGFYKTKKR
jgi:PadR family transcriptional regulator, regulatory protein PadR